MVPDGLPGRPPPPDAQPILTVGEVTAYVKRLLDSDELLRQVVVRGEISNLTRASSGHVYFSLKDDVSQLNAVCFRGAAGALRFEPKDGDRVVAVGSVTVYERGGRYQIIVRFMRPDGAGDLAAALELLKAKLQAEGLFDPSRKRPLPRFPEVIAVCTSPTGAAVRDLTSIIARRYPLARVIVIPTVVQGDQAAPSIARSLQIADGIPAVDVVILGRGGGSIEDLWAFNEEITARAIFACAKPVVSAVGHETDVTVSDLVADARAATPSMAAEMVVPDCVELAAALQSQEMRLRAGVGACLQEARSRFDRAATHPLLLDPKAWLQQRQMRLDEASSALSRGVRAWLDRFIARLERATASLDALNPTAVLGRGYAICRREDGTLIRRIGDVAVGEAIAVAVSDGDVLGSVTGARPGDNTRPPGA